MGILDPKPLTVAAGNATYLDKASGLSKAEAAVGYSAAGLLTAQRARQPLNASLLTSFQAGHGWTSANTPLSVADDTTDYKLGSQSIKVVTTTANDPASIQKTGLNLDATGKTFRVWFKVDGVANLSEVLLYAGDTALANTFSWVLLDGFGVSAQQFTKDGEWIAMTVSWGDATVAGSPNRAAIQNVRLRVRGKNGFSVTAHYNGVALINEPTAYPNGVVSITYDDSKASQYSQGQMYLDKYGFGGTYYTICDQIDQPGYMTMAQLKAIANYTPSEIAAHAFTKANHDTTFPNLAPDVLDTELRNMRVWLQSNGFKGGDHIAYPQGAFTADVLDTVNKYYGTGRTILSSLETLRPAHPLRLRSLSVSNLTTVATVKSAIDRAYANKSWLILTFHDLVASPVNGTEYSIANYQTIIDYLATKGIPVQPVGEVMQTISPSVTATAGAKSDVVVAASGGDYTDLASVFAANPTGNVNIFVKGTVNVPAPLNLSGVKNVTIRGGGWEQSKLVCTSGLVTAGSSSDQWTIADLRIEHAAGTNTHDAISVDYPRRWSVRGCYFVGFGGASIRYRGGIHSEANFNYFLAEDSTNTNGLAAIYVEKSAAAVVATTIRTRGNYVGAGVQYGIYADSAKQSVFDNDVVEGCATGFYFRSVSGELRQPYTEANTVAISILDSPGLLVSGDLRDQPVVTWSGVAAADRRIVQVAGRFINPGKGIVFGGTAGSADLDTAPSIRWGTGSPEGVVTGVVGSEWNRTDGAGSTTKYVKESGTGNTGWAAMPSSASDPAVLLANINAALGNTATSVNAMRRHDATTTFNITNGTTHITCFTPISDVTISKLSASAGSPGWAGTTLARLGLYTVTSGGVATLVAQTANDTTLFSAANSVYEKSLDTAGGYPASYTLLAGQRYAIGVVGMGTTAGGLRCGVVLNSIASRVPTLGGNLGAGGTDLALTGTIAANGTFPWSAASA